ncbi:unnamed protein product [Vitrella brassicaformis CCMP3155]|uniref:YbaK/aminoacyl-tRNA synthetase-associated domain-containing protein n=2 Tax=Vitrella brassicaformis TaxID=1169539 RepID=A0A0G4G5A0_VITBC|nr:unnamed protein product [Vitrella brassicaformis CCMP3155]|eukprot:CEM23403.1 unnamed protein product [Vitrella brassicaformis CCMP3155]
MHWISSCSALANLYYAVFSTTPSFLLSSESPQSQLANELANLGMDEAMPAGALEQSTALLKLFRGLAAAHLYGIHIPATSFVTTVFDAFTALSAHICSLAHKKSPPASRYEMRHPVIQIWDDVSLALVCQRLNGLDGGRIPPADDAAREMEVMEWSVGVLQPYLMKILRAAREIASGKSMQSRPDNRGRFRALLRALEAAESTYLGQRLLDQHLARLADMHPPTAAPLASSPSLNLSDLFVFAPFFVVLRSWPSALDDDGVFESSSVDGLGQWLEAIHEHPTVKRAIESWSSAVCGTTEEGGTTANVPSVSVAKSAVQERLEGYFAAEGVSCELRRVPPFYYDQPLQWRADCLSAPSVDHLCKTVIIENSHHAGVDDAKNSRFYAVVIQYTAKLNKGRVKDFVKSMHPPGEMGNKRLNFVFADEEVAAKLTGYVRNATTPFVMQHPIPVIVSRRIMQLRPPVLWLGGGEVDLKLLLSVADLCRLLDPFVADVTFD